MGDWTVVVSGTGSHHNAGPGDADRLAQRFVEDLVDAQQNIRVAIITYGGLGVLDTITPERDRYERQLAAASARDPNKFPYDGIEEKLREYDNNVFDRETALSRVNLMPMNRAKAWYDQQVVRGLSTMYRWAPGQERQRSIDGGKTWEPAPELPEALAEMWSDAIKDGLGHDLPVEMQKTLDWIAGVTREQVPPKDGSEHKPTHTRSKGRTFTVNGKTVHVGTTHVAYDDIVKIAKLPKGGDGHFYTITAHGKDIKGSIVGPGEMLDLEGVEHVSVADTSRA